MEKLHDIARNNLDELTKDIFIFDNENRTICTRSLCLNIDSLVKHKSAALLNTLKLYFATFSNQYNHSIELGFEDYESVEGYYIVPSGYVIKKSGKSAVCFGEKDKEEGYPIDCNLWFVILVKSLSQELKNEFFRGKQDNECELVYKLLSYYNHLKDDNGLIVQGQYCDWQVFSKRDGTVFLTNLLYWRALSVCDRKKEADRLRSTIIEHFYDLDKGFFKSHVSLSSGETYYNIESNLFAVEWEFCENSLELFSNVMGDKNLSGTIGKVVYPNYSLRDMSLYSICFGINDLYDGVVWTWIIAFAARVSKKLLCFERASAYLRLIEDYSKNEDLIRCIYEINGGEVSSCLFQTDRLSLTTFCQVISALEL